MSNIVAVNVYQIGAQDPFRAANVMTIGFPSLGILLYSTDVLLETGFWCYGVIDVLGNGKTYKVRETQAQLITLFADSGGSGGGGGPFDEIILNKPGGGTLTVTANDLDELVTTPS